MDDATRKLLDEAWADFEHGLDGYMADWEAGLRRHVGLPAAEKPDAFAEPDLGDVRERAELIAEILYGVLGREALGVVGGAAGVEKFAGKWDKLQHPRGPDGRFIEKGSGAAGAAAKEAVGKVLRGEKSPHSAEEVLRHLNILTVKQLHDLHREHGVRPPAGTRERLVEAIKQRMLESGTTEPGEGKSPEKQNSASTPVDKGEGARVQSPPESKEVTPEGRKMDATKESPTSAADETELNRHGQHELLNALFDKSKGVKIAIVKDGKGETAAAVSYRRDDRDDTPDEMRGWLFVEHLGSDGSVKGAGTDLIRHVVGAAAKSGRGVFFEATENAVSFYERLGFRHMTGTGYQPKDQPAVMGMTAKEAKDAAAKLGAAASVEKIKG